jgi:density-regulated protein DRP1
MTAEVEQQQAILQPVEVIYCAKCGMPPEYCEYGPDFERVCDPWLKKNHPELHDKLAALRAENGRGANTVKSDDDEKEKKPPKPDAPWTIEERLTKFYEKYVPEKVSDVPSLLEKYAGKEDKLFLALVKKYGPEPDDPFYDSESDESDEDDDDDLAEGMDNLEVGGKKRRGVKAKKAIKFETKVLIQKIAGKKKKKTTVVTGMETVDGMKLKDVSKAFSKKFAGSSSVKDGLKGKEIIIQGDHMEAVAEMVVSEFKVPGSSVFLDFDGDVVAYR